MAKTSLKQQKNTGRVMHEFKHDELKSGRDGKGGKVKSRRQAIAIAVKEAGASKYQSKDGNRKNAATTRRKETRGETTQQQREGKSHVGADDRPKSPRSMGTSNAQRQPAPGRKSSVSRSRNKTAK